MAESWMKYVGIFIMVVVGLTMFAALYPVASDAGDGMNDSNMCTDNGCSWNGSRTTDDCTANNATPFDTTPCATGTSIPLSSLFGGAGIVFVVLMAGIFLLFLKKK